MFPITAFYSNKKKEIRRISSYSLTLTTLQLSMLSLLKELST